MRFHELTVVVLVLPLVENPTESPFSFSFGIMVAAGTCTDPTYASSQRVNLPSVHIIGKTDAVVTMDRSNALLELYDAPTVYYHAGGHYVPANKEAKDVLREFVAKLQAADATAAN